MSTIYVETLIEAMGLGGHTLQELVEATGYPFHRVLLCLLEARAAGYRIAALRGLTPDTPTYFVNLGKENA